VVAIGVAILVFMPKPTVGDQGELPSSLPSLLLPDVPLNLETLRIVAPYAFAMALVGLRHDRSDDDQREEVIGMNEPSAKWHALSGNLGAGH
jgi:hypothetical protein